MKLMWTEDGISGVLSELRDNRAIVGDEHNEIVSLGYECDEDGVALDIWYEIDDVAKLVKCGPSLVGLACGALGRDPDPEKDKFMMYSHYAGDSNVDHSDGYIRETFSTIDKAKEYAIKLEVIEALS